VEWYDRAEIYDLLFSWDPHPEVAFLLGASARWGIASPRRILEPFCGSGRLLRALPGRSVGFDRNPHMVRHAARHGPVLRADAARFALRRASFDLAHALIDSFRHLLTEDDARRHLRAVARALEPGAVYVLGLEVTGNLAGDVPAEEWTVEREGTRVEGYVRSLGDADPSTRIETVHFRMEVFAGDRHERIESFMPMRVYTPRQLEALIDGEGSFEIAAVFDRGYDLEHPVELAEIAGSAVLVLQRDPGAFA
jgi:SAM-dependent methyltransferase